MTRIIISNPKLLAVGIILLVGSASFYLGHVLASPSPTISRIVTPGSIGPCTWFISLDGTTPVAEAMVGGLSVSPGDNVVGTTGQDPAAFINTNILAANERICFSAQAFTVSSPIGITANNIVYSGSGMYSTMFLESATFSRSGQTSSGVFWNPAQEVTGVQNITLQNLGINGQRSNRAFLVDDSGIRFDGATNSLNRNILIDHVYITNTAGGCIQSRYIDHFEVQNFDVENCGTPGQGGLYHGVYCIRCWNEVISNGIARRITDGSGVKLGLQSYDVTVSNVISILNAKDGFEFSGGSGIDNVHDVTFSNTIAANNTLQGYDLNVNGGDNRFVFSGISGVFNGQNGIVTNNLSNMTLTGCTMMDNANPGGGWQGIRVFATKNFIISNCRSGDAQSPKTQAYGIDVQGSSYITITGNDLCGNVGTGYRDEGGNINATIMVRNNYCANPFDHVGNFRSTVDSTFSPWASPGLSTVAASIDYVIAGSDCLITSTGGTGVSITIKDSTGTQVAAGLTVLTAQWIPIRYKVNFGAFSVAPTVNVYFN